MGGSVGVGNNKTGINSQRQIGAYGSNLINDTTVTTGTWFAVQVLADAVFTTMTATNMINASDSVGDTFSAGTIFYANFTAITLASGSVIAYKQS